MNEEFTAEPQGCAPGRARPNIAVGENAEAVAVSRALWEHDSGFVLSHVSLLTGALASERSADFSTLPGKGNDGKALSSAEKALRMSPNGPDLNLLIAELLMSQHEWVRAEVYLKRGLGAKSQMRPHLHALLGKAYEHTGRTQDAIRELLMTLSSDEGGSLHYPLARIYSSLGSKATAENARHRSKEPKQKRRERAVLAVQDSSEITESDAP